LIIFGVSLEILNIFLNFNAVFLPFALCTVVAWKATKIISESYQKVALERHNDFSNFVQKPISLQISYFLV